MLIIRYLPFIFLTLFSLNLEFIESDKDSNLKINNQKLSTILSKYRKEDEFSITTEVSSSNFKIINTLDLILEEDRKVTFLSREPLRIITRDTSSLSGDDVHQDLFSQERFRLLRELVELEEEKIKRIFPNKVIYVYRVVDTGEGMIRLAELNYSRIDIIPPFLGLDTNSSIILMGKRKE